MSSEIAYTPSKLWTGPAEILRQHSFTRWMSRDLMQAAGDFNRNLGLLPVYGETSPDHQTRYLFWKLPQGALTEVRSGRSREQFEKFDHANRERNLRLLSLHINESEVYSAVWIATEFFDTAKSVLAAYGITGAERKAA